MKMTGRNRRLSELLHRYFSGQATHEEDAAARKWLSENIADPTYDGIFENILDSTEASANQEKTNNAFANLSRKIALRESFSLEKRILKRTVSGLAASLVAAAVALFVVLFREDTDISWKEVYASNTETENVLLPDGSELTVKSGSRVFYPSGFGKKSRNIYIDGEVYARISKDKKVPFVLSANGIDITVHGTEFNVKAFAERSNVEIVLVEGSITVESTNPDKAFARTMKPGEMVRYDKETGFVENYTVDVLSADVWKTNKSILFMNETLEDIVSDLERRFNVSILIDDDSLLQTRYYASFVNGEDVYRILKALNLNSRVRVLDKNRMTVIPTSRN